MAGDESAGPRRSDKADILRRAALHMRCVRAMYIYIYIYNCIALCCVVLDWIGLDWIVLYVLNCMYLL